LNTSKSINVTPRKATANSAAFTDPIVYLGFRPFPNKVEVTIGLTSASYSIHKTSKLPKYHFVFFFTNSFFNAFLIMITASPIMYKTMKHHFSINHPTTNTLCDEQTPGINKCLTSFFVDVSKR
jgi:hypothetical protein